MNVMNKKGRERFIKSKICNEIEWLAEHCDLLTLIALHEEFGFGADRLKRAFRKVITLHDEFKKKYMAADDTVTAKGRCDTYAMKQYLKRIGFDYDAECEELSKSLIDGEGGEVI